MRRRDSDTLDFAHGQFAGMAVQEGFDIEAGDDALHIESVSPEGHPK
jgi:hypothetical protein